MYIASYCIVTYTTVEGIIKLSKIDKAFTVYTVIFEGCKFHGRQIRKDFRSLIFTDHQVEYIVLP